MKIYTNKIIYSDGLLNERFHRYLSHTFTVNEKERWHDLHLILAELLHIKDIQVFKEFYP